MTKFSLTLCIVAAIAAILWITAFIYSNIWFAAGVSFVPPLCCALALARWATRGRDALFSIGFACCSSVLLIAMFPLSGLYASSPNYEFFYDASLSDDEEYMNRAACRARVADTGIILALSALVGLASMYMSPYHGDQLSR